MGEILGGFISSHMSSRACHKVLERYYWGFIGSQVSFRGFQIHYCKAFQEVLRGSTGFQVCCKGVRCFKEFQFVSGGFRWILGGLIGLRISFRGV